MLKDKIIKYVKAPRLVLSFILRHFFSRTRWLTDESFIKYEYLFETGKRLDLANPLTFNEKLQWLKLHDIHPEYTIMADKYCAKNYVSSIIGESYLIPTIGVWESFDDIDFSKLPDQFVIKTTHDSGGVVIIKDKKRDLCNARKVIEKSLRHNYFYEHREYPYKDIQPRIIAEKYMVDESGTELKDYKIFCFYGEPRIVQVDYDRFIDHKRNLYDIAWNRLPFTLKFPTDRKREIPKPEGLGEMLDVAKKLSKGIPHVRVDLYHINGKIYFGELTFFHGSGFEKFTPEEWNKILGNWIQLDN